MAKDCLPTTLKLIAESIKDTFDRIPVDENGPADWIAPWVRDKAECNSVHEVESAPTKYRWKENKISRFVFDRIFD